MAELLQIEELRTYLVDEGIVQLPEDTGDLPICYLEPRDGAKQPDTTTRQTTLTLTDSNEVVPERQEEFLDQMVINFTVRAYKTQDGKLLHRQIKQLLNGAQLVMVGELLCESINMWRGYRLLGSDKDSFTSDTSYIVAARHKSLAGLPYAP